MNAVAGREADLFALDRSMCLTLLRTQPVGRLALAGVQPEVIPLNFRVVDEVLTFRTAPDSVAAGAVGEVVASEVDMFDERTCSGWSVVARGRLLTAGDGTPEVVSWAPGPRERAMVVTIESLSGRLLRGVIEAPERPPSGSL